MLPVKLVRSLVLGETMNRSPFHHPHNHNDNSNANDADADDEHEDDDDAHRHNNGRKRGPKEDNNGRKMPLLLFTPTKELISDTFRLASIARDIGMDFHPSPSLSHLLFSWPSPSSSPSSSSPSTSSSFSAPFSPSSSSTTTNHRPSISSNATTSTSSITTLTPQYEAVPLPFPSLSTPTVSLSLLRFFVSLSKGLFKLVFFNLDPQSEIERNWFYNCPPVALFSRVSGRRVGSMDDLSREMAGRGWALFRTHKRAAEAVAAEAVYLFQKKDPNRVRARGGGVGECRIRELRLPALDFRSEIPLRILLYILLMTEDIFYLA